MAFLVISSEESGGAALVAWISEQRTMRDMGPPGRQGTLYLYGLATDKTSDGAYYETSVTKKQPEDDPYYTSSVSSTVAKIPLPRGARTHALAFRRLAPTGDTALLLRKQNRQSHFGREHASRVVAAQRDDGDFVLRAELFVDQLAEGLAAGQSCGALSHGRARGIEAAQRENVDFAEQKRGGARGELFLQFVSGLPGSIAGDVLHAVGPAVIGGAVRDFAGRAGGIEPGVAGRVRHHIGDGHAEGFVNAIGHFVAGDELANRIHESL